MASVRLKNVRGLSEAHRNALRSLVVSAGSSVATAKRLGVSEETLQAAMFEGSTFRHGTVDRLEKAIDGVKGEKVR
jgi:hypothetical protein